MIIGNADHLQAYKKQLPAGIYECLAELANFNFQNLPDGKHEINGCMVSVESLLTEPANDRKLEGHRKYIDVVYEIDVQEEWIGFRSLWESDEVTEEYGERDLYFYDASGVESKACMHTGSFAVCFPEDLHRPLCCGKNGPCKIRKAVLKFPVDKV